MPKSLTFLIELDFPTERAYAKNVVSTLDILTERGVEVNVFAGRSKTSLEEIRTQYDIGEAMSFNFSSVPNIPGKLILMGLLHFAKVLFKKNTVISGRFIVPIYFLSFFRKVNFEYHSPLWKQGEIYHFMFKRLMKSARCKSIVVPNKNLYLDFFETFPKYSAYREKIFLVSNGASVKDISIEKPESTAELNLGYIGSFYPGKGLEIIEELSRKVNNCKFHLAGGPVKNLKENHPGLLENSSVQYHGYLSTKEIDQLAQKVDVFLLPNAESIKTGAKSDIGRYTNPLKLFEYMSYYRPIICSDLDYLKDVLGDLGLYCSSTEDWLEAMSKLQDTALRKDYAKKIKDKFLSDYTITQRAKNIESILLSQV
ncbi:MAG: hypothetical protein Roseis2KO_01980 [Roseivirga sp.]